MSGLLECSRNNVKPVKKIFPVHLRVNNPYSDTTLILKTYEKARRVRKLQGLRGGEKKNDIRKYANISMKTF